MTETNIDVELTPEQIEELKQKIQASMLQAPLPPPEVSVVEAAPEKAEPSV